MTTPIPIPIPFVQYNRHYFPNAKLENIIVPAIEANLPQIGYNGMLPRIELFNVKITQPQSNQQMIYAKFHLISPTENWNNTTTLMEMEFVRDLATNQMKLLKQNKNVNCVDIGAVIPQMSDIISSPFHRERDRTQQQVNWNTYKQDWDVKWSDVPYLRHKNSKMTPSYVT